MRIFLVLCVLVFGLASQAPAMQTSPRSSDREIIESLVEIKAGQRALQERFDQLWSLILVLIGGIMALIGFVIWDRKTAMRPLEKRLDALKADLRRDLEIQHQEGSRLTRLVKALREQAKTDAHLAEILRGLSLL